MGKAVVASLGPEVVLQKHAGALAQLYDRAIRTLSPRRPMVRGGQADVFKGLNAANAVLGGGARILARQHIALQVHGQIAWPIHAALLTEG